MESGPFAMAEKLNHHCCPDLSLVSPEDATATPQIQLSEALRHVGNQTPFAASSVDGIFAIRIKDYLPLVCVTLHDGSAFPADLEEECLLTSDERRFEEDPHTAQLLDNMPLVLSGLESRYFYDLNRAEKFATSNEIFGRKVWRSGRHPVRQRALSQHRRFYQLAGALIEQLINQYGSCLVLDLHSYNGSKIARETPLFNLGTCAIDTMKHRRLLDCLCSGLSEVHLPGIPTQIAENDVFEGRGRFVNWIRRNYPQALPLCLEVKKVYCDEHSGELHPEICTALQAGLTGSIEKLFSCYRENYLKHLCRQTA